MAMLKPGAATTNLSLSIERDVVASTILGNISLIRATIAVSLKDYSAQWPVPLRVDEYSSCSNFFLIGSLCIYKGSPMLLLLIQKIKFSMNHVDYPKLPTSRVCVNIILWVLLMCQIVEFNPFDVSHFILTTASYLLPYTQSTCTTPSVLFSALTTCSSNSGSHFTKMYATLFKLEEDKSITRCKNTDSLLSNHNYRARCKGNYA
jgi:hypothetical protein